MNYTLQVVQGRSDANMLRLMDGVNSIGRHDDCLIRIRSSQVSRRHCELFEEGDQLILRDLGSSNGTYVNGKRVLGRQNVKPGDILTIGSVSLRVGVLDAAGKPAGAAASSQPSPKDTAELEALPVGEDDFQVELAEDDEEFEVAIDSEPDHLDIIPLEDEPAAIPPQKADKQASTVTGPKDKAGTPAAAGNAEAKSPAPEEEDAVAQFLMDLKLDEDE